MEQLLEMLNRIEQVERELKTAYSPRLTVEMDGSVRVGWLDIRDKKYRLYGTGAVLGNITKPDELATNLERWALQNYEKVNKYG